MILVAEAALGAEEIAALTKVLESGWITMGDRVRAFEQAFEPRDDARHQRYSANWSVNGTAALPVRSIVPATVLFSSVPRKR